MLSSMPALEKLFLVKRRGIEHGVWVERLAVLDAEFIAKGHPPPNFSTYADDDYIDTSEDDE